MPPVRVTVCLCTWNRASLLRGCLEALERVEVPAGVQWKLRVVDNNCTDGTQRLLDDFEQRLPLERAFEPRPGVSHARNRAVEGADGEYLLWTDDDIRVTPGWMRAYLEEFERHPEAGVLGGPIELDFEQPMPEWLRRTLPHFVAAYSGLDLGPQHERLDPEDHSQIPYGANFAIRHELQARYRFDPGRGRRAGGLLSGEETTLLQTAMLDGAQGRWVPAARVLHFVTRSRQRTRYLRGLFAGYAYYDRDGQRKEGGAGRVARLRLLRRAIRGDLVYAVRRLTRPPERWVEDLKWSARRWGLYHGSHR